MNTPKLSLNQLKSNYLLLRGQYLSTAPMNEIEIDTLWSTWAELQKLGWNWAKIEDSQLRD